MPLSYKLYKDQQKLRHVILSVDNKLVNLPIIIDLKLSAGWKCNRIVPVWGGFFKIFNYLYDVISNMLTFND